MPSVLFIRRGSEKCGKHGLGYYDRPIRISDFGKFIFTASDGEEAGSAVTIYSRTCHVP